MKRFARLVGRAVRRRCPNCGTPGIFLNWWTLRERCPSCGIVFEREEGYFLGGYALNLIFAEFLGIGVVVALMIFSGLSVLGIVLVGVALMVGLPLLLFPFSRTLWMALDLYLHPPRANADG